MKEIRLRESLSGEKCRTSKSHETHLPILVIVKGVFPNALSFHADIDKIQRVDLPGVVLFHL